MPLAKARDVLLTGVIFEGVEMLSGAFEGYKQDRYRRRTFTCGNNESDRVTVNRRKYAAP